MAGMLSKMQVYLQRNGGHIEGNGNLPGTLKIRIDYAFVLNIEIKISFFDYYLLLDGFEYVYLKVDSVFYLLAANTFLIRFTKFIAELIILDVAI